MTQNEFTQRDQIVFSVGWFALALLVMIAGCQKPTSTTSAQPSATFEPQVQSRPWPTAQANYQNVAVEHDTLYLAGPYEQSGGDDIYNELKSEDLFATFACPVFFLGNVAAMPGTLILTPPIQPQQSRSVFPVEAPAYEPLVLHSDPYNKSL